MPDDSEALRRIVRKIRQQNRLHKTEDRGTETDAERHDQHNGQKERPVLREHTKGVPHIDACHGYFFAGAVLRKSTGKDMPNCDHAPVTAVPILFSVPVYTD